MNKKEFEQMWSKTLRSKAPQPDEFDRLARGVVDLCNSDGEQFRQHIKNRSKRVTENTGQIFDPENFDGPMAQACIADELGFGGWDELMGWLELADPVPILFRYAVAAMWRGDFSALASAVAGPENFHHYVVDWYEKGLFRNEQETLDELLSAACMLGNTRTAEFLLDKGVDPYAGMKTWLAGPHYAASSGRLDVIKMLIEKGIPLEVENGYGGTVFGQAIWSAVNEYHPDHAAIVEALIDAGAFVEEGYSEWWSEQNVPSQEAKERIAAALKR